MSIAFGPADEMEGRLMPYNDSRHYWSRFTGEKGGAGAKLSPNAIYHLAIESYIFKGLWATRCGLIKRFLKGRYLSKSPKLFGQQVCRNCLALATEKESNITIVDLPK